MECFVDFIVFPWGAGFGAWWVDVLGFVDGGHNSLWGLVGGYFTHSCGELGGSRILGVSVPCACGFTGLGWFVT